MKDSTFVGDDNGKLTHEDSVDTASGSGGHKNHPLEGLARNLAEIVDSASLLEALRKDLKALRAFSGSLE